MAPVNTPSRLVVEVRPGLDTCDGTWGDPDSVNCENIFDGTLFIVSWSINQGMVDGKQCEDNEKRFILPRVALFTPW